MNKKEVDKLIPNAVTVLKTTGIANDKDEISKSFRGQISTFGAAVVNGSLLSAVAFFSDTGSASVDRVKLIKAIKELIPEAKDTSTLFEYISKAGKSNIAIIKEQVLNAAIALKLAMNLYKLIG